MLLSYNWLKDLGNMPNDINEFKDKMILTGTMVESIKDLSKGIENVVTAKIEEVTPHPDSDHLVICKVNAGSSVNTVVTGAPNVKVGQIVPYAKDNSTLPDGTKIKTSKLRGVTSEGMLCSAQELGIASSLVPKNVESGLYVFSEEVPLGLDITKAMGLDDYIVEFELTNNRQDCNSVLGIAYEAVASQRERFIYPDYIIKDEKDEISPLLDVEIIDNDLCPKYLARMLKVKEVKPSPLWMQQRLMKGGMRPISNIVDVSNYVMMEIGQPLHMFDYDKLEGNKIIVQKGKNNAKFVTLDGIERTLDDKMLMISDAKKDVAAAGVMGGLNSDIDESTKTIVIESANFNKNSLRRTSKIFGLRSEASARYEKGLNPLLTRIAIDRAAKLLVEIGACELINGIIEKGTFKEEVKTLSFSPKWVNKMLGTNISDTEMLSCLEVLSFEPKAKGEEIEITVPKLRSDIEIKEDIAEEIARIYGYDKIPMTMPKSSSFVSATNLYYDNKKKIKNTLIGIGALEILSYSFISPSRNKGFKYSSSDIRSKAPIVVNPLGEDTSVMRTTLLNGLLESISINANRKNKERLLFEIGNVYFNENHVEGGLPYQKENLILGKYKSDYFEIKGVLEFLLEAFKITGVEYEKAKETTLHPERSALVKKGDTILGYVGQIHPSLAKEYGIKDTICVAELDLQKFISLSQSEILFKPLAKYPSISRDIAVVVDKEIYAGSLEKVIYLKGGEYLVSCKVFDVYEGENLGLDKKSIAFALTFRSDDKTLTDKEAEDAFNNILSGLENKYNAKLR